MTRPRASLKKLAQVKAWEMAVRFVFGGTITVVAGLVAKHAGNAIGGLFLAFPAILPASLTLVKRHDGRAEAVADARGGRLGALALGCFALAVTSTVHALPFAATLALATAVWIAVAVASWHLVLDE